MDQAEIAQVQLIVSLRIYDVLMAILTDNNKEVAHKLREIHKSGRILFDEPSFSGEFMAD